MKTHRRGSLALASIALAAIFGTASCNALLGIDGEEYRDVALELCDCDLTNYLVSDCANQVRTRLAEASPEERERWLGEFETRNCEVCELGVDLVECLQGRPVCREAGESCSGALDCCGVYAETGACIGGSCAACIRTNDPAETRECTVNADCCGGTFRDSEVYCHEGRCFEEAPLCKNLFETCASASECCGSESGPDAATCRPGLGCFEQCLAGDVNCPDCCVKLSGPGLAVLPGDRACGDGPQTAEGFAFLVPNGLSFCDMVCELGVTEDCPAGYACKSYPVNTGISVQLCLAPDCPDGSCPDGFACAPMPVERPPGVPSAPEGYEYPLCVPRK